MGGAEREECEVVKDGERQRNEQKEGGKEDGEKKRCTERYRRGRREETFSG